MLYAGIESVSMDMNEQKLTLTGDIDPVAVVGKLRKLCHTEILSVGPAKEPPKKEEKKKPEDQKKKTDQNHNQNHNQNMVDIAKVYEACQNQMMRQPHYYYTSVEENPNACVIC